MTGYCFTASHPRKEVVYLICNIFPLKNIVHSIVFTNNINIDTILYCGWSKIHILLLSLVHYLAIASFYVKRLQLGLRFWFDNIISDIWHLFINTSSMMIIILLLKCILFVNLIGYRDHVDKDTSRKQEAQLSILVVSSTVNLL